MRKQTYFSASKGRQKSPQYYNNKFKSTQINMHNFKHIPKMNEC